MSQGPQRTKILFLLDAIDGVGGTEGQLVELLRQLDRERFEAHVAFFRQTDHIRLVAPLVESVRVFDVPRLLHPGALPRMFQVAWYIRRHRFQLVHVLMNAASIAAPLFCRLGGARVIGSRRDMGFWYRSRQVAILRLSNRLVARIVANSDAVRQNVHRCEGYPLSRIDVCYNGHDLGRFDAAPLAGFREQFNIGASDPIVGMVANFSPWKRHVDLLQAFALVRQQHPRAHLVLVGSGDLEAEIAEAAEIMGLEGAVHFAGSLADPIPVVKHFTVGVLCSSSEGLSNAVIEYMGCAKPVVCTNVGGNPEIVRHGHNGFVLEPGDISTLAARISQLLALPWVAEKMGRRGRETACGLTTRRMAERHMLLYETLLRPGAHPALALSSEASQLP